MKKVLINLLILWSLILCGFVAYQWLREARLRADVQTLTLDSHKKSESIANLEGTLKTLQAEIERLDALKQELTESTKTNRLEITELRIEMRKLLGEKETLSQQVDSYKSALTTANANIREQNESIQKQNAAIKEMADQRNAAVVKQNEVVQQFNDLVKRYNEAQELLAKLSNQQKTAQ